MLNERLPPKAWQWQNLYFAICAVRILVLKLNCLKVSKVLRFMRLTFKISLRSVYYNYTHKDYVLIVSFKSSVLQEFFESGDVTLLPSAYVYEVAEVLEYLDAAIQITDLELLGGFTIYEYQPDNWSVTVTVNSVEPVGSVTCMFMNSNAYDVDLNQYD